jgi:hypothetical protein
MKFTLAAIVLLTAANTIADTSHKFIFGENATCRIDGPEETEKLKTTCETFFNKLEKENHLSKITDIGVDEIFINIPYVNEDGYESLVVRGKKDPLASMEFTPDYTKEDIAEYLEDKKLELEENKNAVSLGVDSVYCEELTNEQCDNNVLRLKNLKAGPLTFSNVNFVTSWEEDPNNEYQTTDDAYFNTNESDNVWKLNVMALSYGKKVEAKIEAIEELSYEKPEEAKKEYESFKKTTKDEMTDLLKKMSEVCITEQENDCDFTNESNQLNEMINSLGELI